MYKQFGVTELWITFTNFEKGVESYIQTTIASYIKLNIQKLNKV